GVEGGQPGHRADDETASPALRAIRRLGAKNQRNAYAIAARRGGGHDSSKPLRTHARLVIERGDEHRPLVPERLVDAARGKFHRLREVGDGTRVIAPLAKHACGLAECHFDVELARTATRSGGFRGGRLEVCHARIMEECVSYI